MQPDRRDAALLLDMIQFAEEIGVLLARAPVDDYLSDLATAERSSVAWN